MAQMLMVRQAKPVEDIRIPLFHQIQAGDSGEVLRKLALGKRHAVIIRWDKIPRSRLSIDGSLFECVRVVE